MKFMTTSLRRQKILVNTGGNGLGVQTIRWDQYDYTLKVYKTVSTYTVAGYKVNA